MSSVCIDMEEWTYITDPDEKMVNTGHGHRMSQSPEQSFLEATWDVFFISGLYYGLND